jgi:hypothetical protein
MRNYKCGLFLTKRPGVAIACNEVTTVEVWQILKDGTKRYLHCVCARHAERLVKRPESYNLLPDHKFELREIQRERSRARGGRS